MDKGQFYSGPTAPGVRYASPAMLNPSFHFDTLS